MLKKTTKAVKSIDVDDWREETVRASGPMGLWDIIAQQLEDFIERHE
ncbi:MAG: hypothetical protein HKN85_08960 [Gammaproteobacteria bacterium]|nr:hypothetical protein [Gammaproteobacteria bacterium]